MDAESKSGPETSKRFGRFGLILSLILIGAGLLYYAALSPKDFGRAHDDSIYVTTAKALARGEGYRIISLPYEPAQTKYPPLYPFLLSLIWGLFPHFPNNLIPMMLLTIAAALGFLALSYRYLVQHGYATRRQAFLVVALVAINWRTVALVTTLYSEMLYALISLLALHLADEYEKHNKGWIWGAMTGIAIGLTFLTRSLGLTLLVALAAHSILHKRWKRAVLPLTVASMFAIAWLVWCYINRTTSDGSNVAYYTDYFGHISQVVTSLHLQNNTPKWLVLIELFGRNILMFTLVSPVVVLLGLDYSSATYFGFVSLFILAGFIRQVRSGLRLMHIYLICYIAMAAVVPFPSYDRYLIPLLPFFLLFVITEAERLILVIRNDLITRGRIIMQVSAGFIGLALLLSVGTVLYNHFSELSKRLATTTFKKSSTTALEDVEAIEWINNHTNSSDVLVCYHDPVYFLHTGRKATRSLPMQEWVDWRDKRNPPETVENLFFRTIRQDRGRYLVVTSKDFESEDPTGQYRQILEGIIAAHPERFFPVFDSSDGLSRIFRIKDVD
jgi:4-amino-4-deoxy-L-arabinose transferase-like glycosyltransferase